MRPVVPFQVVGLMQRSVGVHGVATEGEVVALPLHEIGQRTSRVTGGGDRAEQRGPDLRLAIGAEVVLQIGYGEARCGVIGWAAIVLVLVPERRLGSGVEQIAITGGSVR